MLARLFPLNSNNITQETYLGIKDSFEQRRMNVTLILLMLEALILKLLNMNNRAQGSLFFIFNKQNVETQKQSDTKLFYNYLVLMYVFFGAPVVEEIAFRGMLTPALEKLFPKLNINTSYAAIASSILFGCLHPNGQKLSTIYFGIKQEQLTKINNGSLWGGIAGHGATILCSIFPPFLFTLYGLINAVSTFRDEAKKLTDTTEGLTDIKIISKTLSGAMDGAKTGGTNSLCLIPSIIISQIQSNNNFTECFTGSLTQTVKHVTAGAAIGATLGACIRIGVCLFSHKLKHTPKLIVEDIPQKASQPSI